MSNLKIHGIPKMWNQERKIKEAGRRLEKIQRSRIKIQGLRKDIADWEKQLHNQTEEYDIILNDLGIIPIVEEEVI